MTTGSKVNSGNINRYINKPMKRYNVTRLAGRFSQPWILTVIRYYQGFFIAPLSPLLELSELGVVCLTGNDGKLAARWSCAMLLLGMTAARIPAVTGHCDLAELTCRDGRCVPLDAYCNGRDDCGDGSDEPALCTPCNRTYNGREGRTYELDLPRPTEARLPFLCHLTFTASGPGHGELVQLLWDAFSIGRLETVNGDSNEPFYSSCPEGSLQLAELGKPFTGGSWCGPGEGRASYYSETSTVTASIRLFHAPSAVPFEFRLRYRFISRNEAVARLGEPGLTIERGSPVPGTYCSRNFYECHKKQCRVQSPNYPGEYPRNASCLITVRQKFVPTCKHAMISIKAASGANTINNGASILHKGLSSSSLSSFNNTHNNNSISSSSSIDLHNNGNHSLAYNNTSKLSVWQDCPPEKDRLVFRDGPRLEDAILLVYCGGPLPRITARGPSMLIEFRSSPLAIPLGSSPLRVELQVPVVYVDSDGLDYARGEQGCHFFVNDTSKRHGILRAPQHTLPLGSVCTWNIKGSVGDRIWFYFSSFTQRDLTGGSDNNASTFRQSENTNHNRNNNNPQCAIKMTLWDGPPTTGVSIVSLCDDTPRLCAHAALRNSTRSTRPCTQQESYITITPTLTLRMEAHYGTALRTVNFQARYEFISTLQGGEAWGDGPCSRVWRKVKSGEVMSPRDVRLYGRGGKSKLECSYRIEAGVGERIRLTIHNVSLGDATNCISELDIHSSRPKCLPDIDTRDAKLTLYEAPWRDVKLPRACLCDNTSHLPLTYISVGKALELTFLVDEQAPYEDFETLFFYASFELIRVPDCPRKHRLRGEGGELRFVSPPVSIPDIYCEGMPWLVEARESRSLFVLTWGWFLPLEPTTESSSLSPSLVTAASSASGSHHQISQDPPKPFVKCPTSNRLLLYSGWPTKLLKVVCPVEPGARDRTVHIFSEEWLLAAGNSDEHWLSPARPASLLVEFVAREHGQATASWLEISKSRSALHRQLRLPGRTTENDTSTADCLHTCPELGACIASSLWCDGHIHCPSGHDEANCGSGARLLGLLPPGMWLVVAVISGIVTAFACLLTILVCKSKARAKKLCYDDEVKRSGAVPRRAPTEESLLGS